DAFRKVYGMANPALDSLAVIVRGVDTARPELAPQSRGFPTAGLLAAAPIAIDTKEQTAGVLGSLLAVFLKAGSLTFGSGLVIVPFLEKGLVQQTGWLNGREFLVAVAVGMLSPGPVVITATFVGYLVAGFWGSLVSTIGIFVPSFILILAVAPIL